MDASQSSLRIAFMSMHTSPLAAPGSADAGGMNVVEINTAQALAELGHHVDMITRWDDPELALVTEVAERVRVINLRAGEPRPYAKSAQEELLEPFGEALREFLVGEPALPDVLHSHHWFSGVAALPVARELGIPHVQTYHSVAAPEGADMSEGEAAESPGRRPGERLTARGSDLVIAVSEAEKTYICQRYGLGCDELIVVHPGVNVERFRPLRAGEAPWRPTAEGRPYLFFAARLQPLKGPDLAIRTLAALPEPRPMLVVAGAVSADFADYADELHGLVDELGVTDDVVFLGPLSRDDLATLLRSSEMLIMPSYSETFGLIALEAQASGVPVVATHAGGLPEAVVEDVTGVLLDSREPWEWATAVEWLLGDDDARLAMGRRAREHALTLTWHDTAEQLVDAYRDVIDNPRSTV